MTTSNDEYRDAALRHQIGLRRYTAGFVKRVSLLLEEADKELSAKLRKRLVQFRNKPLDFTGERWRKLLLEIKESRALTFTQYRKLVRSELHQLSLLEAEREAQLLASSIPIEISFAAVAAPQLQAIVNSRPFQGRLLRDWFKTLSAADQSRLQQQLQLGMLEGEPVDDLVRRVVGTRKNKYADGVVAATRRDATAIVRTAVNHVSNSARNLVWSANSDIITAKVWSATLDGRTSAVCRARDGKGSPVGDNKLPGSLEPLVPKNATPPAHVNCRSTMIAYIDGVGLVGNRPTVTDTRDRRKREIDFRKIAIETGKPIQQVRRDWANRNIGGVPAETTYGDFLKRQPVVFQDEVLGKTKGRLFRKGGLELNQFVDRAGNELTLAQLADTKPQAFIKAGLDPEQF